MTDPPQGPVFLFGGARPPPYHELLAQMPKRSVTDKLVSRYFNSYDPAVHILHPPSWYRAYERYWENPDVTCVAWLGQLYAILCLAMHSYYRMDDEPPEYRGKSLALSANYRALTGQCLLLADFIKPMPNMIETMVLHLHCEYARTRDAEVGIWVLVGMIVRLAMRMGYHRDPKSFPQITPFQGEIRRRVWTFIRQSDLLFSFQIGLPSMIRSGDCDTELPHNLFDDEFDEDSKALPPSRPATEPTPVSYMCAKANMTFVFGKVVERLHSIVSCPYDEIMSLDQELRDARAELPPHLRQRSLEDCAQDPGALVMQRFNLSILYHKAQCVLHRKFLAKARENNRYVHSRRTCVDSSMELLNHQATLHYQSRAGHRLHGMKVFISSLTAADFLLAAMIVSLDLCYGAEADDAQGSADMYTWGLERRVDMIQALEVSREIWLETRDTSMEAYKASELLSVMLKKLHDSKTQPGRPVQSLFPFPGMAGANGDGRYERSAEEKPEHSAAMTLGMLSTGGVNQAPGAMFQGAYPQAANSNSGMSDVQSLGMTPGYSMDPATNGIPPAPSPLSFLGAGNSGMDMNPSNLDWVSPELGPCATFSRLTVQQDAWDSYVQNVNLDTNNQIWQQPNVDPALAGPMEGQTQPGINQFGNSPSAYMGIGSPGPGNLPI